MAFIYDLVDTWNNAASTFTAIKMNVTDTASNAASLLMDLQVGTVSKFKVDKNGLLTLSNNSIAWAGGTATVTYNSGHIYFNISSIGDSQTQIGKTSNGMGGQFAGLAMSNDLAIAWSSTSAWYETKDLKLFRDTAGTIAQRNSTNAQTYRLYGTYTDGSNYERGYLTSDTNGFTIGTEAAGTGTKRPVRDRKSTRLNSSHRL